MGKLINIKVRDVVYLDERRYEFVNFVASELLQDGAGDDLQFRDCLNHRIVVLSTEEFDRRYLAGRIVWAAGVALPGEGAPPDTCLAGPGCVGCARCVDSQMRANRLYLLKAFDANPVPKTDLGLQAFIDAEIEKIPHPQARIPKAGTLRRLLRERGSPGDRRPKQVGDRRRHGPKKPRIHPLAEDALWLNADPYWSNPAFTAKDVWAAMRTDLVRLNRERGEKGLAEIAIPSRVTVWRMVTHHADFEHTRLRFGARMAARTFKPLVGKLEAKRILDVAIMDHTVLDCFVVDDEHNIPVGRPYLTFLIDVRSRYPLSYVIGFTPPSVESAMACVRAAVRPKLEGNQRHPDISEWLAYGVPRTILVDNGWEFVGSSFKDACEDAGISIEWAPVRTPEYKGIIERFFGVLNKQLIHKLKGAVPFKPHMMGEYGIDPQANAVILLSELDELIHYYVADVYGKNFHSGIKAVPAQVWMERQAIDGIDYAHNLTSLDLSLGKLGPERTLSRKGIEFNILIYSSQSVFGLLNDLLPTAPKRGVRSGTIKIKFKYWPEDISKISVWNPVRGNYVEVQCLDKEYTRTLSEHHHLVLSNYARDMGLKFSSEDERCAARSRLNAKIASFVNDRSIGNRKRSQRLVERHADSPSIPNEHLPNEHHTIIETITNRHDGEHPKRTAVRTPKSKRPRSKTAELKATRARPSADATAVEETSDPFEGYDFAAVLEAARRKSSQ